MRTNVAHDLFAAESPPVAPSQLPGQLLKWIGNKYRFAPEIVRYIPQSSGTYIEPFVGSGAVLAALCPSRAIAGDAFGPLIEIWQKLKTSPDVVVQWYTDRYELISVLGKGAAYLKILKDFNQSPNGADFLFLSRACYGGVVRFRKKDGAMSTPVGAHKPMPPDNFANRAYAWHERVRHANFVHADYKELLSSARRGDVVYCDPPYQDSQAILYGAQAFVLEELFQSIQDCKNRGVFVALSIDGTKKSGKNTIDVNPPAGLFNREIMVQCGRSMLKRFQMTGRSLESEEVSDRLLLTY